MFIFFYIIESIDLDCYRMVYSNFVLRFCSLWLKILIKLYIEFVFGKY